MPTLEAGTVFVQVAPSFKGFQKAAAQAGVSGGETLAKAFEKTASQAKANLNGSVEGADEEGAKAAAEFQAAFQAGLKAATARLPKVKVDADSSPADRKIAALNARMTALSDKQIGVDIDAADAFLEMGLIEAELVKLSQTHPDIEVRADIVKAITELQTVAMAAEALDDKDVDIEVKADTRGLTGMGFAVQSTAALVGGLVAAIGLIGPAAVAAANVATGAIIGIGAAASGAAAAIGTAVLALAPIVGKTIAFRQVKSKKSAGGGNRGGGVSGGRGGGARQDTAKMDARRVANAQKQVAAARKASVKSTQAWAKRVRDAERNVAKVSAASAKQVAAAQKNLSRVRQQAATRVESANRAVVASEKQLVAAQRGVEKAQRNLSKARRDAVKDLRDMQSAIKNGVLAERSAVLAVKLAKKNLEDLGKTGGTALEWEQARLNLDKANQALEDQKSANRDLAEEKARTDREGVEGTERVRVARQALVEAEERVQDAVEAVAEARENAARVAVDAAESVAGAEQRVVDARFQAIEEQEEALERLKEARAAAQEAAEEAAEREQEAKERLAQTVEDIADRNRRMGAAATSAGVAGVAAAGAVADALEGLPESGKAFVLYLDRLIDKFGELSVTAQNGFLPGLMRGLQATEPLFKPLNALIDDLSRRLGRIAENGLKSLTDPGWQRFGQFLADNLGPAMDTTATIIANILAGIRDLVIALKPLGEYFLNAFEAGTAGFADWAANLDSNQDFQNWMKGVMEEAPKVGELIGAIASALGNLWGAAMGGEGNMSTLDRMTGFFQKIADMDPGQIQTIANAVIGIGTAFAGLGGLAATGSMIGSIANGLKSVGSVLGLGGAAAGEGGAGLIGLVGNLGSKLAGLAGPIGIAVAVITTLFAAIKTLWDTNEGFRNAVSQAWEGIQATFQNAYDQVFKPVFEGLGELFGVAGNAFDSEFATVVNTLWNTVLGPLFDLVSTVVGTLFNQVLIPLFGVGATAFRDLVKNIKDSWDSSGKPLFDAISKVAKDVLEVRFGNVLRNVKKLFEDMVKGVKDILGGLGKGFEAFGRFLKGDFTGAWRAAKDAIGRIWKGIRQVVAAPVNFVINVVYNNGLRAWFNKLAGVIGAPVRMPYRPPIRFASGGVLPGYTPGRDVHRFWSPTGGLLYLSGGEGIIRPDALRAMGGKKWLDWVNRNATRNTISPSRRFAKGGILDDIGNFGRSAVNTVAGWAKNIVDFTANVLANPLKAITDIVLKPVRALLKGTGNNIFSRIIASVPTVFFNSIIRVFTGHADKKRHADKARKRAENKKPAYKQYDQGGWLPPGLTNTVNLTGKPEPVFTSSQWEALSHIAKNAVNSRENSGLTFNIQNYYPQTEPTSVTINRSLQLSAAGMGRSF
ncbi:transglycosylase [Mobiluncus mulieris]|uniref:transglycosylase n=1 Tax=Mobiluncus mulieris TaxID=2052 RepID=UPI0021E2FCFB|nr:transglycosylase [Mobiluncus mulieris]MCU9996285.1 transglycosylase [Mobiluncus mulieris]MCV0012955.1 transglycosylase [Mobiluncus mulieris]